MKKTVLGLVAIVMITGLVFISCSKEESTGDENNLSNIKLNDLKLDLNFDKVEDKTYLFDKKLNLKEKADFVFLKINNLNSQISFRLDNDNSIDIIEYSVTIKKDRILINNWRFIKKNLNRSGGEGTFAYQCPSGQTLIANCWSENCVKNALEKSLKNISSGDTVNITVHHGGAMGGVSICAG